MKQIAKGSVHPTGIGTFSSSFNGTIANGSKRLFHSNTICMKQISYKLYIIYGMIYTILIMIREMDQLMSNTFQPFEFNRSGSAFNSGLIVSDLSTRLKL